SALQHRTRQIAMDGSQKLPQRLVAPLLARRAEGQPIDRIALAIAGWMRWQSGIDDAGRSFTVDDPLAADTQTALEGCANAEASVRTLLGISAIFPAEFAADEAIVAKLADLLDSIQRDGTLATLG